MSLTCDWSFKHYVDTVDAHKKVGTEIVLRHDLDFSLEKAMEIAKIEASNDYHAFYFILFGSQFYTPLTQLAMWRINSINMLGHSIGLHYKIEWDNKSKDISIIIAEKKHLEEIVEEPVNLCSRHRVTMGQQTSEPILKSLHHIGMPDINDYLKDFKYLSDSGHNWREGCFCEHIGRYSKLMVLTHPIWWNKRSKTRGQCITDWYNHENFKRQNIYKEYMSDLVEYDKKISKERARITST